MSWPNEGIDPFPVRRHREPEQLRRNILDELSDHLACAAEEEIAQHACTEAKAWATAVDRFGNPDAIARRLWWDAMKERIMRDWFQTGLAAFSAIVVLIMAVFVILAIRSVQTSQTALVQAIQEMKTQQPAAAPTENLSLNIDIHRGTLDGPPAQGIKVSLSGKLNTEDQSVGVSLITDAEGKVRFQPVPQGSYTIFFEDPQSSLTLSQRHSLFAGVGMDLHVIAPAFGTKEVQFTIPPELEPFNGSVKMAANLKAGVKLGDFEWEKQIPIIVDSQGMHENFLKDDQFTRRVKDDLNHISFKIMPVPVQIQNVPSVELPACQIEINTLRPFFLSNTNYFFDTLNWAEETRIDLSSTTESSLTLATTGDAYNNLLKAVKMYCVLTRWYRFENIEPYMNSLFDYSIPVPGYLVASAYLTDAVTVHASGDLNASIYEVEKPITEDDRIFAGNYEKQALIKLEAQSLAQQYPEARFYFSGFSRAALSVRSWKTTKWTNEPGGQIELSSLQDQKQVESSNSKTQWVDVTDLIRGENPADTATGLLFSFNTPDSNLQFSGEMPGLFINSSKGEFWAKTQLMVVQDTPPGDL